MLMEAMVGFEHKFSYAIVGHSGSSHRIPLVEFGKPPKNVGERAEIVQQVYGYSNGAVRQVFHINTSFLVYI